MGINYNSRRSGAGEIL